MSRLVLHPSPSTLGATHPISILVHLAKPIEVLRIGWIEAGHVKSTEIAYCCIWLGLWGLIERLCRALQSSIPIGLRNPIPGRGQGARAAPQR